MVDKRINIRMSEQIFNYYEDLSNKTGLSKNSCIVMALKQYIDQQTILERSKQYPDMIDFMKKVIEDMKERDKK